MTRYMPKRGAKRDGNEGVIVATFEAVGATTYKLDQPCDRIVGFHGTTYLVEIKNSDLPLSKQKLTPSEDAFFHGTIKTPPHGGNVHVVRDVEEALLLLNLGTGWTAPQFNGAMINSGWSLSNVSNGWNMLNCGIWWTHPSGERVSHREWSLYWRKHKATPKVS